MLNFKIITFDDIISLQGYREIFTSDTDPDNNCYIFSIKVEYPGNSFYEDYDSEDYLEDDLLEDNIGLEQHPDFWKLCPYGNKLDNVDCKFITKVYDWKYRWFKFYKNRQDIFQSIHEQIKQMTKETRI